jgi:hypothetical protein
MLMDETKSFVRMEIERKIIKGTEQDSPLFTKVTNIHAVGGVFVFLQCLLSP